MAVSHNPSDPWGRWIKGLNVHILCDGYKQSYPQPRSSIDRKLGTVLTAFGIRFVAPVDVLRSLCNFEKPRRSVLLQGGTHIARPAAHSPVPTHV